MSKVVVFKYRRYISMKVGRNCDNREGWDLMGKGLKRGRNLEE